MIINTGSRTDIPAYYSEWFYNRIRDGYVLTRNPYYPEQITRYRLDPEVVDCLVFCTKNPEPMLERLDEIRQFKQFWGVTITPYGRDIEPYVPDKEQVMESFRRLSNQVGVHAVSWRYDPIFVSDIYDLEAHVDAFEHMAAYLSGYTDHCVISFIDLYAKTKRNFPQVKKVTWEEQEIIGRAFSEIGRRYGIGIRTCCEGTQMERFGIDSSGCMTKEVIERAIGGSLQIPGSYKPAREACRCLLGNDIGMYNTCGHGCLYCYANYDRNVVTQNRKLHDPTSPFLIGKWKEGEMIHDAKQVSYYDGQMYFSFL